ncbi:hypothetical protein NLI96_g12478 [Meripilus lineatus]|uniref:Uncharacterized protein n=1 Tax=Meripilus lineatus TaxID=2056292 RepID=A0AAD5UPU5_9APHY|nr:hypothetical protein NLI96_g12478 [Physisporinus lineatus]
MQSLREKENIDVKEEVTSSIDSSPTTDVIEKAEEVALEVISPDDDPDLPVFTARTLVLGVGLSAFGAVLSTIYTFKPQART